MKRSRGRIASQVDRKNHGHSKGKRERCKRKARWFVKERTNYQSVKKLKARHISTMCDLFDAAVAQAHKSVANRRRFEAVSGHDSRGVLLAGQAMQQAKN
jgi:hypothetical protein